MRWPHATQLRVMYALCVAMILVFSSFVLFYKLGNEPFQDYDEATYAEVTRESLLHGNYLSLTFQNQPYFRKPPLLFWLTTSTERIIASPERADRLPSAFAALLTVIVVMLVCYEAALPTALASLIALLGGAVMATIPDFAEFARDVRFDTLVSFFITLAFYFGVKAAKNARWYLLVGIALGLAFLSKNVITVFGGVALLSFALMEYGVPKTAALIKNKYVWGGVGTFLLVVAPWHLIETIRFGMTFWHNYLGTEVFQRASVNLFPNNGNPTNLQYIGHLLNFGAPWVEIGVAALCALPFLYKGMNRRTRSITVASLITICSVLLVMFTAKTKAYGYLMPLYPFLAIFITMIGAELWKRNWNGNWKLLLIGVIVVLISFAAYRTYYDALHINPYFGWEIGQAYEERDVAMIIKQTPNATVYTYNYPNLGTISYYANLPQSANSLVLLLSSSSMPNANSFVLTLPGTSIATVTPRTHFKKIYDGAFVSLFTVAR